MKKVLVSFVFLICVGLFYLISTVQAHSWYEHAELKITIETATLIYEWEYENPHSFEYEKGNTIVRGEEAKASFEEILHNIDLNSPGIEDKTIQLLEKEKFGQIERMVVRRLDVNHCYQTWLWRKGVNDKENPAEVGGH